MGFLSVSIDMSGSTLAKQAIVAATEGDSERRAAYYADYLRLLYATERDFYRSLLSRPLFRFSDLFLVKMIGDEFWWVYETDDENPHQIATLATAFFLAVVDLFSADRYLTLTHDTATSAGLQTASPARQFNLPLKAFIDHIGEATEVNLARYEFLKDVITMARGDPATVYRVDERFVALCERLNLGAAAPSGSSPQVATRTDFIGLEIDRFFRLTGCCKPALLGIGCNLMQRLAHSFVVLPGALEAGNLRVLEIPLSWDDSETAGGFRKYVIEETVPSQSMKGISADYTIYHVFGADSLGEDIYAPPPEIETLMSPTRAFLAEHGFFAMNRDTLIP